MKRSLAVFIALALLVAACGDDDSPAETTAATTAATTTAAPQTTTTAAPVEQDIAADTAAAERALLGPEDLGPEWVGEPDDDTSDDDEFDRLARQLVAEEPACAEVAALDVASFDQVIPDAPVEVDGVPMVVGPNELEQGISVWPTQSEVADTYATVNSLNLLACYQVLIPPLFQSSLEPIGADILSVTVEEFPIGAGELNWGVQVQLRLVLSDRSELPMQLSLIAVSTGRVVTDISLTEIGGTGIDIEAIARQALDKITATFGADL